MRKARRSGTRHKRSPLDVERDVLMAKAEAIIQSEGLEAAMAWAAREANNCTRNGLLRHAEIYHNIVEACGMRLHASTASKGG